MNDRKIPDIPLWQNCYPFVILVSSKYRNSKVFRYSDFKIALIFVIVGHNGLATNTHKLIKNVTELKKPDRKKTGTFFINKKKNNKLAFALWNKIQRLEYGSLLFIAHLILLRAWGTNLPNMAVISSNVFSAQYIS